MEGGVRKSANWSEFKRECEVRRCNGNYYLSFDEYFLETGHILISIYKCLKEKNLKYLL